MSHIPAHTVADAPEQSRESAEWFEKRIGRLMNIHARMAHSPAVITAYEGISRAIAAYGTFDSRTKEAIALAIANQNSCDYCQASHTISGRRAGLTDEQMLAIRTGEVDSDPKIKTITELARAAAANFGYVSDPIWQAALDAGWREDELAEAFAHIMANLFTNYFNHYAGTELDIPAAPPLVE